MSARLMRVVASASALALGLTGIGALSSQASTPDYGNIVDKQDAKITIHKLESGSLTTAPVTVDTPDGAGDFLNGVPFKLYRLNLTLTTPEGWTPLQGLDVPETACTDDGAANFDALTGITGESVAVQTVTTSTDGSAAAAVSTGAYLVCEQTTTEATNKAGEAVKVVKKSHPFVVTAPTPHPGGAGWLYDVHVYPKNTVVQGPTKTMEVTQQGLGNANGITVTLKSKIPSLGTGEHFKYFALVDPMPADMADAQGFAVSVEDGGPTLADEDFVATYGDEAPHYNAVTIRLKKSGLEKVALHKNKMLKVTFTATMKTLPSGGQANNTVYAFVGKDTQAPDEEAMAPITLNTTAGGAPTSTDATNPAVPGKNTAGTTWGTFKIKKVDAAHQETTLNGAKFKVYVAADANNCTGTQPQKSGEAITVNGVSEFETENDGTVSIAGVHIDTLSADTANPEPQTTRCFVIEETQAPAGFVLPEENARLHAVLVNSTDTSTEKVVSNTQVTDLPELPVTGAAGQLLLMIVGTALMLGSVGAFFVLRRRQAHKA